MVPGTRCPRAAIRPMTSCTSTAASAADLPPDLRLIALVVHARDVPSEAREAFGDAAMAHRPRPAGDPAPDLPPGRAVPDRSRPSRARSPWRCRPCPRADARLEGSDAARHVFTVAAGLDSVVVGEDQILHQLRECRRRPPAAGRSRVPRRRRARTSRQAIGLDPLLERLFQVALHLGRETRSWREGPPRSLGDVAARPDPARHRAAARAAGPGRRRRPDGPPVRPWPPPGTAPGSWSPTGARTAPLALAHDANGEPAPFGPDAPLPEVDAVILAISARWPLSPDARADLLAGVVPGGGPLVARRPSTPDLRDALGRPLHVGRRPRPQPAGRAASGRAPSAATSGPSTRP